MPGIEELLARNEQMLAEQDAEQPALTAIAPPPAEQLPISAGADVPQPPSIEELLARNEQMLAEQENAQLSAPAFQPPPAPVLATEAATPARVNLYDDAGQLVSAPREDAQRLIDEYGYQTPESWSNAKKDDEYGSGLQSALAATEAFARGSTFGLSDLAAQAAAGLAGSDQIPRAAAPGVDSPLSNETAFDRSFRNYGQEIESRKEANPWISGTAELAGTALTAIATLGTGTAAQVAAATPAGATALLGSKVQTALISKLGSSAVGRIAALGGAGAAESVVQGAIQSVVDDVRAGDFEITAERAIAGGFDLLKESAVNALVGFGLGASIGGLIEAGSGAKKLFSAAKGKIASRRSSSAASTGQDASAVIAGQEATQAELNQALDQVADVLVSSADDVANDAAIFEPIYAKMGSNGEVVTADSAKRARELFAKARASVGFDKAQQTAVTRIGDSTDDILRISSKADESASIAAKRRDAVKFNTLEAGSDDALRVYESTTGVLDEYEAGLRQLSDYGVMIREGGGSAAVKDLLNLVKAHREKFTQDIADGLLGDAAMAIDDLKRSADKVASRVKNPKVMVSLQGETGTGGLNDILRLHLENESVFGGFAVQQKLVNRPWAERIRRQRDQLLNGITYDAGENGVGWRPLQQAGRRKIGSLLDQIGGRRTAEVDKDVTAIKTWLRSLELDVSMRAKVWGSPELAKDATRIRGLRETVESEFDAVRLAKQNADQWKELTENVDLPIVGWALKGAANATKTAARLSDQVSNETVERIANSAAKQEAKVMRAAKATATRSTKPYNRAVPSIPLITSKAIDHTVRKSRALVDSESPERMRFDEQVAIMANVNPDLAAAIEAKSLNAAQFLVDKAGPVVDASDPLINRPTQMNSVRARKMQRYTEALSDPNIALDRLSRGVATPEDKEVLLQVYPRLYQRYVDAVVAELAKAHAGVPDRQSRQRLHYATGVPMARSQRPEVVSEFQQSAARSQGMPDDNGMEPAVPLSKAKFSTNRDERMGARSDVILSRNDD